MPLTGAKFSGHQSFAFRNTWITKGVNECKNNPSIFREPDALVTLGVGKNMVDSIKYWCQATRVITDDSEQRFDLCPSGIGKRVFLEDDGWDPYLEDEGTLWLLHWLLATNSKDATTIYYAFNELHDLEFTRSGLIETLWRQAQVLEVRTTPNTIKRDVGVFIHSYVGSRDGSSSVEDTLDCPLAELGLLMEEPLTQTYAFSRGPKNSLPDAVFFYALWEYAKQRDGQSSLTFDELAYFPGSPGRVFKLDEAALAERLEQLARLTHGAWQLTDTAGYRQVTIRTSLDASEAYRVLGQYYRPETQEDAHV